MSVVEIRSTLVNMSDWNYLRDWILGVPLTLSFTPLIKNGLGCQLDEVTIDENALYLTFTLSHSIRRETIVNNKKGENAQL